MTEMLATAALMAARPAPVANLLYFSLLSYKNEPAAQPTTKIISLWIAETGRLIRMYEDLQCHLVEVQVAAIDRHLQTNLRTQEE